VTDQSRPDPGLQGEPVALPEVGSQCRYCWEFVPSKNNQGRHFDCVLRARRSAANAWKGGGKLKGAALVEHRNAVKLAVDQQGIIK